MTSHDVVLLARRRLAPPAVARGPAPRVGEHSRDVLRDLGYGEGAIDQMIADKVVRVAEPKAN